MNLHKIPIIRLNYTILFSLILNYEFNTDANLTYFFRLNVRFFVFNIILL